MNSTLPPLPLEAFSEASLRRAAEEIERGRKILCSPIELRALGWDPRAIREGWALIRDAEAALAEGHRRAARLTTSERLLAARQAVARLGKDWNPQGGD